MKFKVISCKVFEAELTAVREGLPHEYDFEWIELGEHARPGVLREKLQAAIRAATDFDAVLLGYGLCGMATAGVSAAAVPLVLPRSHDCCGILLGSRKRFEELFRPMPSTPFASVGFAASGDYYFRDGDLMLGDSFLQLVAQYGEDDARYVWEAMHPKLDGEFQPVYFIHTVSAPEAAAQCRDKALSEGREFRELSGDPGLLRRLLAGEWDEAEFLVVPPGRAIRAVCDWDEIIALAPAAHG